MLPPELVADVPALLLLEQRYVAAVAEDVGKKLGAALSRKTEAAAASRADRLQRDAQLLRAQLAQLRGQPARWPSAPTRSEARQLGRWRQARQAACLVAFAPAAAGRGLMAPVGTLMLSVTQPQALLPPPFPSSSPPRLYISNMAVAPAWRRRGVASRLLAAADRLAARWGSDTLWLHVGTDNASAAALYSRAGYEPASSSPFMYPGQQLMRKPLAQRGNRQPCWGSAAQGSVELVTAASADSSAETPGSTAAASSQGPQPAGDGRVGLQWPRSGAGTSIGSDSAGQSSSTATNKQGQQGGKSGSVFQWRAVPQDSRVAVETTGGSGSSIVSGSPDDSSTAPPAGATAPSADKQ